MKTVGIIGGIGPESTIEYYRFIISGYRKRAADGSYPPIIINSIDLTQMVTMMEANEFAWVADRLLAEIEKLERAGADFALLASNTPHIVFDELRRRSVLPLISIVEATCAEAKSLGMKRLGLFGSKFTMRANFYQETFLRSGIEVVVPAPAEQDYIHEKYMGELIFGHIVPETRDALLQILARLNERENIEGLILGGTELPLILRDAEPAGIRFLDTTQIHVDAIVTEMLT